MRFVKDGILRDHYEIDGYLYDDYIYAMLKKKYQKLTKAIPIFSSYK